MNPIKPFKCRNKVCAKEIALTDGGRLYVGKIAIISEQTVYTCGHCDFFSRWIRLENPTGEISEDLPEIINPYAADLEDGIACPECQEPIGLTDGVRFYASGMVISTRIVYICLHCGRSNVWKPPKGPVKTTSTKTKSVL